MVVKKLGYEEIDLDLIERGKSQARQEKINIGIEDLARSIEIQGLMEPVHLVKITSTGKYDLIDGQRRFQAFSRLRDENREKFSKIPCFLYEDSMLDWERKSFSLNANLTQSPMTNMDKTNAVTSVFNHFGNIKDTVKSTGLSEYIIRKHVKISRLPLQLKKAVEGGDIPIAAALDATDIHDYDVSDPTKTDVSVILTTAKEMQKLAGKQKKKVKEIKKEQPEKDLIEIIEDVKTVKRTKHSITIDVESDTYDRIGVFKERENIDTVDAISQILEDGLDANDV